MKPAKPLLPVLATLLALGSTANLAGQESASGNESKDVVQLPSFVVSSTQANEYRAIDSSSASRIRGSINDMSSSISVLTPEFLEDIAPTRLFDATRYVSGISEGRGDGFADRQIIRGFENLNRTVDNFSSIQGENSDPLFIDHVEVLKGPSAIIAPTGAPGGVVSVVSKVPLAQTRNTLAVNLGLIDAQRVDLDMTGPFSPDSDLSYRLLAGYQNGWLASSGTRDRKKLIGGAVSYRLSPQTTMTLRGSFEDHWLFVYLPVFIDSSSVNGADARLADGFKYGNNRNGTETWAHRGGEYASTDFLLTTAFNRNISSRFAAKYQYNLQRDQFMAAVTPGLGNRYNPHTGQQTPDHTWALVPGTTDTYVATPSPLFDITNIQRRPFLPEGHTSVFAAQWDVVVSYHFGEVDSTMVAGLAYDHQNSFSRQLIGASLPFNLLDPVYGAQPVFDTVASRQAGKSTQYQAYINQQLRFLDDRILLTAGAVRVDADSENRNLLSGTKTTLEDSKNLFLYGIVLKPAKDISVYGSRSVNAVPTIANNLPLWQEGQQYEFGAKMSFLENRLSFTAAHFQISQTNVTVPNPAYQSDNTQPQFIISDIKNHGNEFELMGGITENLSVVASITFLHERDSLGRHVRAIAGRNAALFLNYKFKSGSLKGLSTFVGVTHTGRRSGEAPAINFTPLGVVAQPSFFLAPVTLLNLGANYSLEKISFALNIDNALDKEYIGIPTARTNAGLGLPRNIRLTTTYKF